jgi:anthranilate synthase component II
MLLLIDNYDSFTYNLYQYIRELGEDVVVKRNDAITAREIGEIRPDRIVISPGPCGPAQAGVSVDAILRHGPTTPLLGVCLGHQSIGHAFGGKVVRAPAPMHGKSSLVRHFGTGIFAGLPNPVSVVRYHSLIVERDSMPDCLEITAWTDDGTVMGIRHREYPIEGVQFHPESILTESGKQLLANFLSMGNVAIGTTAPNRMPAAILGGAR